MSDEAGNGKRGPSPLMKVLRIVGAVAIVGYGLFLLKSFGFL